jgi:hypothetical protein
MRIVLACLLVGCVATESPDTDTDTDTGSGTGSGSGSGSAAPVASGTYQVRSNIDLTVEVLLPQMAADAVVTLRDFSTNPAQTMLDLAAELGVPAVQEIRDDLPDYVEDKLEGWINGEINKLTVNGVPVPQVAGNIAALAETALTQFELDSELTIAGTSATHTLKAIDLAPAGLAVRVELAALPGDIITATPTCSASQGTLTLGDHSFGLPYGEYMWTAINQAVTAQYGTDVHGVIANTVNCPVLAHTVAAKCYWGYCVGHETQLTEICNAGVDEMVERAHDKFAEMRFDAIHFAAGTATLVDADHDGSVEALTSGVWTAEINAGMGLRYAPATFTATK